jgi:PAS domain-containing protein
MKKLFLIFCLLYSTVIAIDNDTNPAVTIAGIKVTPEDMVRVLIKTADEIEKAAQQSREAKQRAIEKFESQLVELGKKRDSEKIGQNEFDQAKTVLTDKIERLKSDIEERNKTTTAIENNVQQALMSGYQTLLTNYQEEQTRKTQIAVTAVQQSVANEGMQATKKLELDASMEKLKYISQPENLKQYGIALGGATIATVGSYYSVKLLYRYIEQKIEKQPLLVIDTSFKGWINRQSDYWWSLFGYTEPEITLEENIVFNAELEDQLKTIAQTTRVIHDKGLPYPSLLLYGPPGTGKTWYATLLARMAGMDYVITSADRFAQFAEGEDVEELHNLLDWSKNSPKGMLVFIDEIDTLGGNRNTLDQRWIRLQNAFLARTGTSSTDFKIIGATNRFDALDPAFVNRFAQQVYVPLPEEQERERMIKLYLKKYITQDKRLIKKDGSRIEVSLTMSPDISKGLIHNAAQKTAGFSGRQLEQMIDEMRTLSYLSDDLTLSKDIFQKILINAIHQHEQKNKSSKQNTQVSQAIED